VGSAIRRAGREWRRVGFLLSVAVALVAWGSTAQATVWHVDVDATGANDGASWIDAFNDLQDALAAAASGDEIWVAEGTYTPGATRDTTFSLLDGVALYGGFSGTEKSRAARNPDSHETVLSGEIGNPSDVSDNCLHVVSSIGNDGTAVLDGFAVTGSYVEHPVLGGGMYNENSSPTVRGCVFRGNRAENGAGGGMLNFESSPAVTRCVFTGNTAGDGGGMYNLKSFSTVADCEFRDNRAVRGAGMFNAWGSPTVQHCTFRENHASSPSYNYYGYGGGMYNSDSSPTVTECMFEQNTSAGDSGGVGSEGGSTTLTECVFTENSAMLGAAVGFLSGSSSTVTDCTFSRNSAQWGGGIYVFLAQVTVARSTFSENTAGCGGGIMSYHGGVVTILNSTFSANRGGTGGGVANIYGTAVTVRACTFVANTADRGGGIHGPVTLGATLVAANSAVQGPDIYWTVVSEGYNLVGNPQDCTGLGSTDLTGVDPQLVPLADNGGATWTCALRPGSPARDVVPSAAFPDITTDQRGASRPIGQACDIGAYEASGAAGDVNGDGVWDLLDVRLCLEIAQGYLIGTPAQREEADVDGDRDVDLEDARILAEYVAGLRDLLPVQRRSG